MRRASMRPGHHGPGIHKATGEIIPRKWSFNEAGAPWPRNTYHRVPGSARQHCFNEAGAPWPRNTMAEIEKFYAKLEASMRPGHHGPGIRGRHRRAHHDPNRFNEAGAPWPRNTALFPPFIPWGLIPWISSSITDLPRYTSDILSNSHTKLRIYSIFREHLIFERWRTLQHHWTTRPITASASDYHRLAQNRVKCLSYAAHFRFNVLGWTKIKDKHVVLNVVDNLADCRLHLEDANPVEATLKHRQLQPRTEAVHGLEKASPPTLVANIIADDVEMFHLLTS